MIDASPFDVDTPTPPRAEASRHEPRRLRPMPHDIDDDLPTRSHAREDLVQRCRLLVDAPSDVKSEHRDEAVVPSPTDASREPSSVDTPYSEAARKRGTSSTNLHDLIEGFDDELPTRRSVEPQTPRRRPVQTVPACEVLDALAAKVPREPTVPETSVDTLRVVAVHPPPQRKNVVWLVGVMAFASAAASLAWLVHG